MKSNCIIAAQYLTVLLVLGSGSPHAEVLIPDLPVAQNIAGSLAKPGISAEFLLASPKLSVGEPIILRLNVTNNTDDSIVLSLGANRRTGFVLDLKSSGVTASLRGSPPAEPDFASVGRVSLMPGASLQHDILVSEWFPALRPGDYELHAKLANPIAMERSNTMFSPAMCELSFSVVERRTDRLRSASEQFLNTIRNEPSLDKRWFAARSLTYVIDPAAILYIEDALRADRWVDDVLIGTLVEQNNERSIEVLLALLNRMADHRSSSLVESALKTLEGRVNDARMKEKIRSALSRMKLNQ